MRGDINPAYHVANRPFFDSFEMKGGGDAASAARAVLQTAEYDFAWNIQVEDDILRRFEQSGKGRAKIYPTGNLEHIQCNFTDPRARGGRGALQHQDDPSARSPTPPSARRSASWWTGRRSRSRSTGARARPPRTT